MLHHIKKHKHVVAAAGLLVFVSGCFGAVEKTADQLSQDAIAPIVVPIREGNKAIDRLEGVEAGQEERNAEIEAME